MSKTSGYPKVSSLNDLLAVAYQIEIDAVERYNVLADQMETHNNPELDGPAHRADRRLSSGDVDVDGRSRRPPGQPGHARRDAAITGAAARLRFCRRRFNRAVPHPR